MKEGPVAGKILVLAARRADDATAGGFEIVFFVCVTQILFLHTLTDSQPSIHINEEEDRERERERERERDALEI